MTKTRALMIVPLTLLAMMLASGPLKAQTIWRCGSDGRSYSDRPCNDEGSTLSNSDRRNEAELRAAREVLARDQALARELHRQNREAEHDALSRGSGLAGITAPQRPMVVKPKAPKSRPRKPSTEGIEIWKAVVLGSR